MSISVAQLVACGIGPTAARVFADPLSAACQLFAINSPVRRAAFIAQCSHESVRFTVLEENLYYRMPERIRAMWPTRVPSLGEAAKLVCRPALLANCVYSGRNGNGDQASGDGWLYRGRGLIQLTGRANYRGATQTPARDYEQHPELVATPGDACLTAAHFWATAGCNELADGSQIDAITRKINGPAMAGALERRELFRDAMAAMVNTVGA